SRSSTAGMFTVTFFSSAPRRYFSGFSRRSLMSIMDHHAEDYLPCEMRERLVRVGHAMRVFTCRHGLALFFERGHEFIRQPISHRPPARAPARLQNPAECQTLLAALVDL